MNDFKITTNSGKIIRFNLYTESAPVTCAAFVSLLPFKLTLIHARVSGKEIWSDNAPPLEIIQENASVFTEPGEVVYGPSKPSRTKTANCLGIYYGEGRGLDAANIFAKVTDQDLPELKALGEKIWKEGQEEILFEL